MADVFAAVERGAVRASRSEHGSLWVSPVDVAKLASLPSVEQEQPYQSPPRPLKGKDRTLTYGPGGRLLSPGVHESKPSAVRG